MIALARASTSASGCGACNRPVVRLSMLGVLLVVTEGQLAELARPSGAWRFPHVAGAHRVDGVHGLRQAPDRDGAARRWRRRAPTCAARFVLVPLAIVTLPFMPRPRLASPVAWLVLVYHANPRRHRALLVVRGVERVGPSRAAIFLNVTPLVGMALAALLLLASAIGPWQDRPASPLVLGGVALDDTTGGNGGDAASPPFFNRRSDLLDLESICPDPAARPCRASRHSAPCRSCRR